MSTSQLAQERIAALQERVNQLKPRLDTIRAELDKVVVGQRYMIDRLLIGLLADGHLLLEGVPGLAKTTAVKTLAQALHTTFSRVQFTPDLLPADVIGTQIYDPRQGSFSTRRGPVFANLLLADEINRAPAKVQSALLEAMQERQVTIGEATYPLPRPFFVLATQNPIEQEGTYPLPEAQVDRFLMKLRVGYPSRDEEREILRRATQAEQVVEAVWSGQELLAAQQLTKELWMEDVVADYIVDLVMATRHPERLSPELARAIQFGASPRATLALASCARAHALINGRAFVTPDNVKAIGPDVLRHRVLLTYEAEADDLDADRVIKQVFERVKTP
ncbi:MAG: MoxR family ATPase [Deltaproteobacteria bacterium]|jgi:MoxR-like ATPase|nr:MoxR family ATPase [Deltaproteobacteria bacterium]MBK9370674.1 MoxR family ATPase [Deltaproteobacteria bacterium]